MPRAVGALVLREMATSYGRSAGGYLWAVAEPVLAIALLSVVFSLAFRGPPLGESFPLFFALAYLPFMMFLDVANKLATAIRFSKPLLAYPAVTLADVLVARFVLNVLTHLVVTLIVCGGILLLDETRASPSAPEAAMAMGMAAALGLGVGTLNCYLFTGYPVFERIWSVVTRPLVIVSGLFFLFESMPREAQALLWWNPLFHITGEMRAAFHPTYAPDYVSPVYVLLLSLVLLAAGLMLLRPAYRDFVDT